MSEAFLKAIEQLFNSIPIKCANCCYRNPPSTVDVCINCGEDMIWDPPTCEEHYHLEESGDMLPDDCPKCDDLTQDYESNKEPEFYE